MSSAATAKTAEPNGVQQETRTAPICGPPAGNWEEVYAANVVPVYRFVYAKTGNRADAEDLTSQVFLLTLPHLRIGVTEEARAYLFATARTQPANHWRDRYGVLGGSKDDVASPPTEATRRDDAERRIQSLLALLSIHYRRVLELRFLRGFSIRGTAREIRITAGNAKVVQDEYFADALEFNGIDKPLVNDSEVVRPSNVAPPDAVEGIVPGPVRVHAAAINPVESRPQEVQK